MDRAAIRRPLTPTKGGNESSTKPESDISNSDTDTEDGEAGASKIFSDLYNPKDFEQLDVPADIKELFQYIVRYTPQKVDIEYRLQPFIPDYIPAVGDIDAFLKVVPPLPPLMNDDLVQHMATLGLTVLDEPCLQQTDPALLHMKLCSVSTGQALSNKPGPPPSIARSSKDIDRWLTEIQTIHNSRAAQQQQHGSSAVQTAVGDIDLLMSEWPPELEKAFENIGFPSAQLDCSVAYYVEVMCTLLDIPLPRQGSMSQADYINALHTVFTLFTAIRNN